GDTDSLHRPSQPSPTSEFSSAGLADALNSHGDPAQKIAEQTLKTQIRRVGSQDTTPRKRDRANIAVLLGCGLRRRELADLSFDHLQRREDRWAIVDLVRKSGHVRTVPVPDWVKGFLDVWFRAAGIISGKLFRCVCRSGTVWGDGMTEKVVWHIVKMHAK